MFKTTVFEPNGQIISAKEFEKALRFLVENGLLISRLIINKVYEKNQYEVSPYYRLEFSDDDKAVALGIHETDVVLVVPFYTKDGKSFLIIELLVAATYEKSLGTVTKIFSLFVSKERDKPYYGNVLIGRKLDIFSEE